MVAGRPRKWFPFRIWPGYEWADTGEIRNRSRHILADTHRVFSRQSRRYILAREWLGRPPRHDCIWCGTRPKGMGGKYRGPIRGGGPLYQIVHLNGNRRDCSRSNLKYGLNRLEARWHELMCVEVTMRHLPLNRGGRPTRLPHIFLFGEYPFDSGRCYSSPFKLRSEHTD